MAEVILIGVGQCGNQICSKFNEILACEHALDVEGAVDGLTDVDKVHIGTYFELKSDGKFDPRSLQVQVVPSNEDPYSPTLKSSQYKASDLRQWEGCNKNWANGRYENGPEVIDFVMDLVRKKAESCDALQGFQLAHSIGGGTGAGLGSLIISRLREDYSECILSTFSVVPSQKVSDFPVEPYSAAFTAHYLIADVDFSYVFDSESLYTGLLANGFGPNADQKAKHLALTNCIAPAMAAATCAFRYPGQRTSNLRSVLRDLVPNPRLHFLSSVVFPVTPPFDQHLPDLQRSPYVPFLTASDKISSQLPKSYQYVACAATYRGGTSFDSASGLFDAFKPAVKGYFGDSHCAIPAHNINHSISLVGNHSSVQCVWERVSEQYDYLYRRKAFLKWYMGSGMDEMECVEARNDLHDLIEEYKCNETTISSTDTA